jgi:hypothetical protein
MIRIRRRKEGGFTVSLRPAEAAVLLELPARLRRVLEAPDFADRVVRRLFPATYEDPDLEAEHRRLVGDDLIRRKRDGLAAFEKTLERRKSGLLKVDITIEEGQFDLWLSFVNDMRILIATELDIQDNSWETDFDSRGPQAADLALLQYLTWLEAMLIDAASGT